LDRAALQEESEAVMPTKRMYSECGRGEVTVTVTPTHGSDRYGKPAYKIRVAKRGMKPWAPKAPLYSFLPMTARTAEDRRRRTEGTGGETLFDDAVGFFDYYRCGEGKGEGQAGTAGLGRACRTKACRAKKRKR
jgi:hypothetical protein